MGFWDTVSRAVGDRIEREASQRILREKDPEVKGLSAETAAAIERGEVEIVDDDQEGQR